MSIKKSRTLPTELSLTGASFVSPREISTGATDTHSFYGFVVWSETATISFEKDPLMSGGNATDFSEKTIPGDGKFYPLTGKNMNVISGTVTLSLRD